MANPERIGFLTAFPGKVRSGLKPALRVRRHFAVVLELPKWHLGLGRLLLTGLIDEKNPSCLPHESTISFFTS
jgi:hypothetical protein